MIITPFLILILYNSLKLLTGAGQLATLTNAGVKNITLPPFSSLPNNNSTLSQDERIRQGYERWLNGGNILTQASFEWEDGTEVLIDEVLPYNMPMNSIPAVTWDVPDNIASLPNLYETGILYDLQQIMAMCKSHTKWPQPSQRKCPRKGLRKLSR